MMKISSYRYTEKETLSQITQSSFHRHKASSKLYYHNLLNQLSTVFIRFKTQDRIDSDDNNHELPLELQQRK